MSTTIRLTRMGRKKRPFYRLIVTDSRNRRDGAYLANLGYYNPFAEPYEAKLHEEEILAWLRKGVTLSDTARALVQREGILYRWDLERKGLDAGEIAAKVAIWRADFASREAGKADADRAVKAAAIAEKTAAEDERKAAEAEAKAAEAAAEAKAAQAKADAEAAEAASAESGAEPAEDGASDGAAEAADPDKARDEG